MRNRMEEMGQGLQSWFGKVEQDFQKRSGWRVQSTLNQFSKLKGLDKVLFGGLLVGKALIGHSPAKPTRRPAKKRKATAH